MSIHYLLQIFSLVCVPAVVSSETVDAGVCGLEDDSACHSGQIESIEEQEGAAVKLKMFQRRKERVVAPVRTRVSDVKIWTAVEEEATDGGGMVGSKVDDGLESVEGSRKHGNSQKISKKEKGNASSVARKDHNDNICILCNQPLAERVNREYKEFRTDCGGLSSSKGPNASILDTPVAQLHQVGEDGAKKNGFCQLNFAKSCVDAVANKDYLYWAKGINLISGSSDNAAWDGRYCRLNGFLETSMVALQHDFQATQTKAAELCTTKYKKYNVENITFKDMMSAARYNDKEAPALHEAELLAAWNCAMGDLGCDMAFCAYSFCEQGSGIGMYSECEGWHPVHGMPVPKGI